MIATFINHNGVEFSANESELAESNTSMLEYIKYCLDRNSILVKLEVEEAF